jgi:hypothetical protein
MPRFASPGSEDLAEFGEYTSDVEPGEEEPIGMCSEVFFRLGTN